MDPALQLGVFADGSGSDEELLAALEQSALGTRGRRGGRGRGRARAGGSSRARGRGRGHGRSGRAGGNPCTLALTIDACSLVLQDGFCRAHHGCT